MNIRVKNNDTKEVMVWTIEQIIEEINRDRSDNWIDYDLSDWNDGWNEWCEGIYYSIVK
jgi:hypothetical protein